MFLLENITEKNQTTIHAHFAFIVPIIKFNNVQNILYTGTCMWTGTCTMINTSTFLTKPKFGEKNNGGGKNQYLQVNFINPLILKSGQMVKGVVGMQ